MANGAQNNKVMKGLIAHQLIRNELIDEIVTDIAVLNDLEKDPAKAANEKPFNLIALAVKTFLYHHLTLKDPAVQKRTPDSELDSQGKAIALYLVQNYNGSYTKTMAGLLEQAENFIASARNKINSTVQNGQQQKNTNGNSR